MSARRLRVLIQGLPADAASRIARAEDEPRETAQPDDPGGKLAPVKCLADIPVAKSMAEVGKFVNSSGDEFSETFGQAG
jgi:hypothetical protein